MRRLKLCTRESRPRNHAVNSHSLPLSRLLLKAAEPQSTPATWTTPADCAKRRSAISSEKNHQQLGRLKLSPRTRERRDCYQQKHREALLRHTMEIRRQKLADMVHQKSIRQIPVNMKVQLVAIGIDETREHRQHADQPQPLQPTPNSLPLLRTSKVLDPTTDEIHAQQSKANDKSAVQIDQEQHQSRQPKESSIFFLAPPRSPPNPATRTR